MGLWSGVSSASESGAESQYLYGVFRARGNTSDGRKYCSISLEQNATTEANVFSVWILRKI